MRDGRNCVLYSSFVRTPHWILCGNGGRYVQSQREINTEIWWAKLEERGHTKD